MKNYTIEDARKLIHNHAEEIGESLSEICGKSKKEISERKESEWNAILEQIMKNGLDIGGIVRCVRRVVGFTKINGNLCFVLEGEKTVYPLYYYLRKDFVGVEL